MGKKKNHVKNESDNDKLQDSPPGEAVADNEKGSGEKRALIKLLAFLFSVLTLFLVAVAGVLIFYNKKTVYYQAHFFPNTTINGNDCSQMDADAVIALLDAPLGAYTLEVTGRDYATGDSGALVGKLVAADIGLTYAGTREAVEALLAGQDESRWILYMDEVYDYTVPREITIDRGMLENTVKAWEACRESNMLRALDAYISEYSDEIRGYEVVAETIGTELDVERVVRLVVEAVYAQDSSLDVEELGCYAQAAVKRDAPDLVTVVETVNSWLSTNITYSWNGSEVVLDYETLRDWISLTDGQPVLDEEAVAAFVKKQAAAYDTYGTQRKFKTTLGVELSLTRANYGWRTDKAGETAALIALIREGSRTEREPLYTEASKGMKKGADDIGNSYVEVDMTNQHLYMYLDGALALETEIVTGNMSNNCATPEGIFGLNNKARKTILRGPTWENFVEYWMGYYGNYGMHDASWRDTFGGDIYLTNGSHGCINLPVGKAGEIYGQISKGFPVICYYYHQGNPLAVQETPPSGGETAGAGES